MRRVTDRGEAPIERSRDAKSQQSLLGIFTAAAVGDVALGQSGVAVPLKGRDQEIYVAHVLPLTSGRRRQAGTSYAAAAALLVHKGGLGRGSPFENMVKLYGLTPGRNARGVRNRERGRDACGG